MGNREDGENKFDPDWLSIDNTTFRLVHCYRYFTLIGLQYKILDSDWLFQVVTVLQCS